MLQNFTGNFQVILISLLVLFFQFLVPRSFYHICLSGMIVGGVGMGLLWCNFEVFLHDLCLHQMAVKDLVCFACVFLMSCRTCSAGG